MGGGLSISKGSHSGEITLINYLSFRQLGRIPRNPDDRQHFVFLKDVDISSSLIVFVSYKWLRPTNPDFAGGPNPDTKANDLFKLIKQGVGRLKSTYAPGILNCYLWLDFSCVNQNDLAAKKLLAGYFRDIISISDVIFTPVLGKAEDDFETLLNKKFEMSKNEEVKDEDAVKDEDEEDGGGGQEDSDSSSGDSDNGGANEIVGKKYEDEDEDAATYKVDIHIFNAINVAIADKLIGSSDPYVVVKYGDEEIGRTPYVANTLNAYWNNQAMPLSIPITWEADTDDNPILEDILFEVWDFDMIGSHDFLGGYVLSSIQLKTWLQDSLKSPSVCVNRVLSLMEIDYLTVKDSPPVSGSIEVGILTDPKMAASIISKHRGKGGKGGKSGHHHNESSGLLEYEFHVFNARELPVADFFANSSDPYAIVKINKMEIGRTNIVKKNLNPNWDGQLFKFSFPADADHSGMSFIVEFWDWDLIGEHNFLGGVEYTYDGNSESNSLTDWLSEADQNSGSCVRQNQILTKVSSVDAGKQQLAGKGMCEIGIKGSGNNFKILRKLEAMRAKLAMANPESAHLMQKETFQILIHSAHDLAMGDILSSSSDPFVIVRWNMKEVGRTKYIPSNLNPHWNCHDFHVSYSSNRTAGSNKLTIEVYDHDFMTNHDFLGGFELTASGLQKWADEAMLKPNVYIRKDFELGYCKHIKLQPIKPRGNISVSMRFKKVGKSAKANLDLYEVMVMNCSNIAVADKIRGSSNPAVALSCNGINIGCTPPSLKTLNPKWKHQVFGVALPSAQKISKNIIKAEVWSFDFQFAKEKVVSLGGIDITSKDLVQWVRESCERPGMFVTKTFNLLPMRTDKEGGGEGGGGGSTSAVVIRGTVELALKSPDRRVLNSAKQMKLFKGDKKNENTFKVNDKYKKGGQRRLNMKLDSNMKYDILLIAASDLPIADTMVRSSDPYAIIKWNGSPIGKTPVTSQSLNVVWKNQVFEISYNRASEVSANTLTIELWDHDTIGDHDYLGGVELSGNRLQELILEASKNPTSATRRRIKLGKISSLNDDMQDLAGKGIIEIGIKPHSSNYIDINQISSDSQRSIIKRITYELEIKSATKLPNADFPFGKSDPYVVIKLNSFEIGKSATVDNTLDPIWDDSERFMFSFPSDAALTDYSLLFEVWDENTITTSIFLGAYEVNKLELQEWIAEVNSNDRKWVSKTMNLTKIKYLDLNLQKLVNKQSQLTVTLRKHSEDISIDDGENTSTNTNWFSDLKLDSWNSPTEGYLSRAWTRLELLYAGYFPKKVDKQRLHMFIGSLLHYLSRGLRPHFVYTSAEMEKDGVPMCFTPLINNIGYFKKLDPRFGNLTREDDRQLILELYDDVKYYIKYTDVGYSGSYENGKRHGKGSYVFSNGDIYEGEFVNDIIEGSGVFKYANGDYYFGDFKENKRAGKGAFFASNGDKYFGTFNDDVYHGHGIMLYANGDVYEGEYFENKRSGEGKMTFQTGYIYSGTFVDDWMDGEGCMSYMKVVESADSADRAREDIDKMMRKDTEFIFNLVTLDFGAIIGGALWSAASAAVSSLVEVPTIEDMMGQSTDKRKEVLIYEGSFMNNQMHGNGRIHYFYGAVYSGDVSEGKANGIGEITYANGDSYKGEFLNDRKHGLGALTLANGNVIGPGSWDTDKYRGSVASESVSRGGGIEGGETENQSGGSDSFEKRTRRKFKSPYWQQEGEKFGEREVREEVKEEKAADRERGESLDISTQAATLQVVSPSRSVSINAAVAVVAASPAAGSSPIRDSLFDVDDDDIDDNEIRPSEKTAHSRSDNNIFDVDDL